MQSVINVILLGIAFAFASFPGQSSHPHGTDPTTIRVDSNLVLVPVTVTDNRGKFVLDLVSADFTLLEDGKLQQLQSLSRENAPISLGIVVDLSAPRRLAFRWRTLRTAEGGLATTASAVVTFELEPDGDVTRVAVTEQPGVMAGDEPVLGSESP